MVASTNAAGCGTRPLQNARFPAPPFFKHHLQVRSSISGDRRLCRPWSSLFSATRDDPVEQTESPESRGRPPRRPPTARAKRRAARAHPPHERGRSLGDARRAEAVAGRVRLAREPDTPCVASRARHRGKRLAGAKPGARPDRRERERAAVADRAPARLVIRSRVPCGLFRERSILSASACTRSGGRHAQRDGGWISVSASSATAIFFCRCGSWTMAPPRPVQTGATASARRTNPTISFSSRSA